MSDKWLAASGLLLIPTLRFDISKTVEVLQPPFFSLYFFPPVGRWALPAAQSITGSFVVAAA